MTKNREAELKANLSSKESFDGKNILEVYFKDYIGKENIQHRWQLSHKIENIRLIHNGKDLIKEAELKGITEANKEFAEFLKSYAQFDDEPCRLDHHGYCQEHNWFEKGKCSNVIIKEKIRELEGGKE